LPFVLSKFILVECLSYWGWTSWAAYGLSYVMTSVPIGAYLAAACVIVLTNLMSGIPMAILFSRILTSPLFVVAPQTKLATSYAVLLVSNYAGNTTLVGSLAGLLWLSILKRKNIETINFWSFAKIGSGVSLVVTTASIGFLCLEVLYFNFGSS